MESGGRSRGIRRTGGRTKVWSLEEGQGEAAGQESVGRFGVLRKVKEDRRQ